MSAVWLAMTPFIFGVQSAPSVVWATNLVALSIGILAGLSYWAPTRHAHLLILLVSIGLIFWGRIDGTPPSPIHQNFIVVGLFLLMVALIPNNASHPPEAWRKMPSSD